VDYYMTVLVQGDREAHDALLSDSVIIQRADGTYVTKDEALDTLYEVTEFQITNVTARLHEEVLVVRWDMAVEMSIDGAPYSSEEAPRIAAFVWSDDRWQIVAYGNFNVPTIPPDHVDSPEEIGEQLANEFLTLLAEQDREGLDGFLSEAFIIQRVDGSTYTKQDYLENIPQSGEFEISNVTARLHDATLVVRWDIAVVDSVIDGVPYLSEEAPRLATFVWSDGRWRLIGYGNFNVPAE
jgi:hypothetical protein